MKVGMPALIEYNTLEENLILCKKLNFDFIELNMNFPYNTIDNLDAVYIKKLQKENNIFFTMHMPDDADIASFYEQVRMGYVKLFSDTIKWCEKSGVKLLNMHLCQGAHMTLPDSIVYINEKYCEEYVNNFLNSIKIIQKLAEDADVTVCIENSSNFKYNYSKKILENVLKLKNINITWDVGHDYISSYTDYDVIKMYLNRVKHMHLHDANKKSDHLVLYDGEIDIDNRLKFANQNNISVLIEVKSSEALKKSKERFNENYILS